MIIRKVLLLHNPGAGRDSVSGKELVKQIEDGGYHCVYHSTKKKGWKSFPDDVDLLVVAGGDGTVRKACAVLMDQKVKEKNLPVSVIPLGVSNNIAGHFGMHNKARKIISSWKDAEATPCDVGLLEDISPSFFIEGFGMGIFPKLIKEMSLQPPQEIPTVQDEKRRALEVFQQLLMQARTYSCELIADGKEYSGKYLLLEIMNISAIGTGFMFSPNADTSDGKLDLILIDDERRKLLNAYITDRLKGRKGNYDFSPVRAEHLELSTAATAFHADDKSLKLKKWNEIRVEVRRGAISFLVER